MSPLTCAARQLLAGKTTKVGWNPDKSEDMVSGETVNLKPNKCDFYKPIQRLLQAQLRRSV